MLYVDVDTYMPTTEAAGVRIVVHDGEDIPYPDAFGFSAPTGFISSFGLHLVSGQEDYATTYEKIFSWCQ